MPPSNEERAPYAVSPSRYVSEIWRRKLSIYDPIPVGDPDCWIPAPDLERILTDALVGLSVAGQPNRARSKVVKTKVCEALGYCAPTSFKKTQPRFVGQNFDTYVQKSNNLQIWNEEISPTRRYVLIGVDSDDTIRCVRVVNGDTLAELDTTGTLTQKYQARFDRGDNDAELISPQDTNRLSGMRVSETPKSFAALPTANPDERHLLSIGAVFDRLRPLIGRRFADAGHDQERNRGAALHRLVCAALGYGSYADDGRFPDVRHQLLEIKLQTSPTIDLGLVTPDSTDPLDVTQVAGAQVRHCDVRYAVFYAQIVNKEVVLTNLVLTTGERFFSRFPQFGGKVLNKKLQIHLPHGFLL